MLQHSDLEQTAGSQMKKSVGCEQIERMMMKEALWNRSLI